jgi:hypothetical protein
VLVRLDLTSSSRPGSRGMAMCFVGSWYVVRNQGFPRVVLSRIITSLPGPAFSSSDAGFSEARMSEFSWSLIVVGTYRLIALMSGILSVYFGYKLFRIGIYEKAGDLKASFGESHLALRQAAPGTFFALFGAIVISIGIWKGIKIQSLDSAQPRGQVHTANSAPISPARDLHPEAQTTPATAKTGEGIKPTDTPVPDLNSKNVDSLSHAPSQLQPYIDLSRIDPLLQKVTSGKPLTDDDRKLLEQWRLQQEIFDRQFHIEANQLDVPYQKHMSG